MDDLARLEQSTCLLFLNKKSSERRHSFLELNRHCQSPTLMHVKCHSSPRAHVPLYGVAVAVRRRHCDMETSGRHMFERGSTQPAGSTFVSRVHRRKNVEPAG